MGWKLLKDAMRWPCGMHVREMVLIHWLTESESLGRRRILTKISNYQGDRCGWLIEGWRRPVSIF